MSIHRVSLASIAAVAFCLAVLLPAGVASAQTSDKDVVALVFPLRGDAADVTFESSILHTALNGVCGGALFWEISQATVYRAIVERRLTIDEARSWAETELNAEEADPLALKLGKALGIVDIVVYGRAKDAGEEADEVTYELRVIDVALGQAKSLVITGEKQLIGPEAAQAIMATFREMRAAAAAATEPGDGATDQAPTGGGDEGTAQTGGAQTPQTPKVDWVASADPNAEALYTEAVGLAMQHDLEAALERLDRAERFDQESPRIKLEQAYVLQRMGNTERAMEACETALALAPQDPDARALHAELRELLDAQARTDTGALDVEAVEELDQRELEEYCKAHPGDREAIRKLARSYEYNGQFGNALRYYEALAELLVGDVEVQAKIGRMYMKLGTLDKAEAAFAQILRWDPSNAVAHEELGRLKSLSELPSVRAEAFDHFVEASEAWPEDYHLESPVYLALIGLVEDELIAALDQTHGGITMLNELLRGNGESPPEFRRERVYAEVEESGTRADNSGEMLAALKPPSVARDMHAKYLEAARLTHLACTKLMLALDTGSEPDLDMAHWTREQAIKAMTSAVALRGELPQPSS